MKVNKIHEIKFTYITQRFWYCRKPLVKGKNCGGDGTHNFLTAVKKFWQLGIHWCFLLRNSLYRE